MRVKIIGQSYELANASASIGELFSLIEDKLKNTGLILSSMKVDGVEITTDYAHYLNQTISEIREIVVEVKSFREILTETFGSAQDYLGGAIPEMEKLCDEFYRSPADNSWRKFAQLLEGLQWLLQVVSSVEQGLPGTEVQRTYSKWGADLGEKIKTLQEALDNSDHVLMGDLLQYEIVPLFSSLSEQIKQTLSEGLPDSIH